MQVFWGKTRVFGLVVLALSLSACSSTHSIPEAGIGSGQSTGIPSADPLVNPQPRSQRPTRPTVTYPQQPVMPPIQSSIPEPLHPQIQSPAASDAYLSYPALQSFISRMQQAHGLMQGNCKVYLQMYSAMRIFLLKLVSLLKENLGFNIVRFS